MRNGHTLNLIATPWIPVIRATGRRDRMRPADLTDEIDSDPILDVDFPRADFRCAALEFLIGLLTIACPPFDDWGQRWTSPPSAADLEAAFCGRDGNARETTVEIDSAESELLVKIEN